LARLAIAKDFLAEYAKLEKNVQSAVESAISKFDEHTYAGLYLEKLQHSRDDRIRTIRVDSFWRGVVLAPEAGDTYCLITVLPHDKANAYAASHRFSVNQALGVLEVRDEEALEQLQPPCRRSPRPAIGGCSQVSAMPTSSSSSQLMPQGLRQSLEHLKYVSEFDREFLHTGTAGFLRLFHQLGQQGVVIAGLVQDAGNRAILAGPDDLRGSGRGRAVVINSHA
jgi:hypothetical protein